ncbi:MAG TPA: hypothetical protein PLN49_01420 [Ferruginibacter sp.]|nr:hypothetical protein [Ferruginibacter sp.]
MNKQEILKFIVDNNNSQHLLDFYNKTYDKLKELNKRIDKLTAYLIIVVFVFLIAAKSSIQSFQVGPISINDISIIVKLLPILFSYLLTDLIISSSHKGELLMTVKLISMSLYKQDIDHRHLDDHKHNLITRLVLPFSYSIELSKLNSGKVHRLQALFGFIVILPFLSLIFLPFYFEFYMLRDIYRNHMTDTLGKISFYLSIWIMLLMLYYLISSAVRNWKDQKAELK